MNANPLLQIERLARSIMIMIMGCVFLGPLCVSICAQDSSLKPDLGKSIEGWFIVREHADRMHVPESLGEAIPEFEAVSIIMRFRGLIISAGEAHKLGPETMRIAMRKTIEKARNSPQVRSLPYDMIESVGRNSTLDIDFADEFIPLLGDSFSDIAERIRPGIDGIAIRRGSKWRMAYPNRMQSYGQAERPDRTVIRLLRELGLPPREPGELRRLEDIEFYRFEVLSLTQVEPDSMPHESFRGARLVPDTLDPDALSDQIGRDAANALKQRLGSDPDKLIGKIDDAERLIALGLFGDYNYAQDKFDPLVGASADQLLAAWALARSAARNGMESRDERLRALTVFDLILERLAIVDAVEEMPLDDPKSAALAVIASLEADMAARTLGLKRTQPPLVVEARERLARELEDIDDQVSNTTLALRLLAAARLERAMPGSVDAETIEKLTGAIRSRVTPDKSIGILPWLLMCDDRTSEPDAELDHTRFETLLDAVISNQIGHSSSLVAVNAPIQDLKGGFVVGSNGRTTATASSLRPLLALAVYRNIELRLGERPDSEVEESYRLGLRFLRQLQIDEAHSNRGPRPERGRGNIRRTPWSNDASLADAAIALLICTERPPEPSKN
ncbi:MAG: hypothetical protein CMJ33_05025 [Phycisphaerae bacterium]|nr:hypothetical protein [Phycisphaerae bacterium]